MSDKVRQPKWSANPGIGYGKFAVAVPVKYAGQVWWLKRPEQQLSGKVVERQWSCEDSSRMGEPNNVARVLGTGGAETLALRGISVKNSNLCRKAQAASSN